MTLVGLQGKLDREIKARVRYAFDAEPDSAAIIAPHSSALELRRLQALTEIGVEHNSAIIFSLPVENNARAISAASAKSITDSKLARHPKGALSSGRSDY